MKQSYFWGNKRLFEQKLICSDSNAITLETFWKPYPISKFIKTYSNIGFLYYTLPWMTLYTPKQSWCAKFKEKSYKKCLDHQIDDLKFSRQINSLFNKGVFSKPSGNRIVALIFWFFELETSDFGLLLLF